MNRKDISETRPTVYSPFPRRLKSPTIYSHLKTLSVGPAGVELSTSRVTARCSV